MTNQISEQQDRELPRSATTTSIDPEQLEEVSVIEPPIWEEIAERTDDDLDTEPDLAEAIGVESIGGVVTTPDWNDVEDLAAAVGIGTPDREILHTNEILEDRDTDSAEPRLRQRWELDPQSAEDFEK
jgi:Family of unknown function (DUF6335)